MPRRGAEYGLGRRRRHGAESTVEERPFKGRVSAKIRLPFRACGALEVTLDATPSALAAKPILLFH